MPSHVARLDAMTAKGDDKNETEICCWRGGGMQNSELPPVVTVGRHKNGSSYANALVKHVVFSDEGLAARWLALIAEHRESRVSPHSTPERALCGRPPG